MYHILVWPLSLTFGHQLKDPRIRAVRNERGEEKEGPRGLGEGGVRGGGKEGLETGERRGEMKTREILGASPSV